MSPRNSLLGIQRNSKWRGDMDNDQICSRSSAGSFEKFGKLASRSWGTRERRGSVSIVGLVCELQ